MRDEHIEFLERVVIQQKLDPLSRGQLALGVLRRHTFFAAASNRLGTATFQFFQNVGHGDSSLIAPCLSFGRDSRRQNIGNLQSLRNLKSIICKIANFALPWTV